jgi:FkbM family methyltransferase
MDNADSFIDIGANIGVFALTIAQAFPDRRVITIEPLASNYLKLEENIRLNHISNIEPLRVAVTDNSGLVRFYVNPIHDGGGSLIEPREYRTADVRINAAKYQQEHPHFIPIVEVAGVRLDEIIPNKSVLKIDVEGAEVTVLKSGINALKGGRVDLMVVEVTNTSIDEVLDLLNYAEFDCFMYGESSPITSVSQFNRRLGNVLCLRRQSPLYDSVVARVAAEEQ